MFLDTLGEPFRIVRIWLIRLYLRNRFDFSQNAKQRANTENRALALTVRCIPVAIKTQLLSGGNPDNELHWDFAFCRQFPGNAVEFAVARVNPLLFCFELIGILLQISILMFHLLRCA